MTTVQQLKYNKFLCEESTLNFTRYFFKKRFQKKFVINDHHVKICEALDKVVSGEIKKLIINIAPRYGKTELAVKNFMAYGLAINPASRFIHLSYSDDLALDNSEEVKNIVKCPEYQQLFGKVQIKPKSDSKKKWYTTDAGGVYATSTAGQVTGFGAGVVDEEDYDFNFIDESNGKFAGALIIDDPIKPEDADSSVARNRINERWDSTIKNRVNSRNTPIIIIMQRLHEEDLCGYLMAQSPGEWTVLSFPCIQTEEDRTFTALWPFKHTLEELQKLRDENENVFERQYQQDPKPLKGQLFRKDLIKRFTMEEFHVETMDGEKSLVDRVLGYIDPADGGGDNLSFPLAKIIKNKVFITDAVFTRDTVEVSAPKCAKVVKDNDASYIRIEKNGSGAGYIRDLRRLIGVEKIIPSSSVRKKERRIWDEYGFIQRYFYFLAETEYAKGSDYDKFMRNIFSYMKDIENQEDDGPDSIAGLSKFIQSVCPKLFTE